MPDNEDAVDLITISVGETYRVKADRAKLRVEVRGSSMMSANMAQTKSREVAALATQLQSAGLTVNDIEVEGVRVEVGNGSVIKTSEACFTLAVTCPNLELLPAVLTVIASQKQATMRQVDWEYTTEESERERRLEGLIDRAKAKALRLSNALGVRIIALHRFAEAHDDDGFSAQYGGPPTSFKVARRSRSAPIDVGIDINHSKEVDIHVEVQYRVSSIQ